MRTRFGLRHLVAVLGLTAAMLPPILLASAPAAHAAVCPPNSGVSVVVDFGQLGSVNTGCASGSPATGLKALSGAGFSYSFVPGQSGMVCRINSLPNPCVDPPPVSAYWSYWIADRGGDWAYSSKGAGNRKPPVGSVEGWAFGAGKPPAQAPPAKGSTGGGGGSDDGGGDSGTGGGGGDDGGSKKSGEPESSESGKDKADKDSSSAAGESGAANGSGSGDGGATDSGGTAADYDNAASVGPQMGAVGGIFGAAVVAVLAAAVGWRVWQRRRDPGGDPAEAPPEPAE